MNKSEFFARIKWLAQLFCYDVRPGQLDAYWEYMRDIPLESFKKAIALAPTKFDRFPQAEKLRLLCGKEFSKIRQEEARQQEAKALPPPGESAASLAKDELRRRLSCFADEFGDTWTVQVREKLKALLMLLARSMGADETQGRADLAERNVDWWERDGRQPQSLARAIKRAQAAVTWFPTPGQLEQLAFTDEIPENPTKSETKTPEAFEQLSLQWEKEGPPNRANAKKRLAKLTRMTVKNWDENKPTILDVPF